MMGSGWTFYYILGAVFLVLWQIERLRWQIAAIGASIKAELTPNPERRDEIMREWREERDAAAKERRWQVIVWGIIIAASVAWWAVNH